MKSYIFALLFVVTAGCAAPQYTVMNANSSSGSSSSSGSTSSGPTTWPEVGTWDQKVDADEDVAIIVAIEDYAFLPDVPGAVQNANDWESYFRNARGMSEVYVVVNKDAAVEEITRFVEQGKEQVGENGTLWFVFIGHGAAVTDGSDGALIGMDAQQTMSSIQSRSLSRKQLVTNLEAGPQQKTVVVLDTCFSGRDPSGELLASGTQPVIPVEDKPVVEQSTVILSAARNDQVAGQLPGVERPAFTYLLLGAMRGWADDGDGLVSAEEAVTYVGQQMRQIKGRQQTPGLDGTGAIALSSNVGETDPGIARLMRGEMASSEPAPTPADVAPGDGTYINTNEGLVFKKPEEWGIGPAGAGVILTLASQYSANAIAVSKQNVAQAHVGTWMSNMNEDPTYIDGRTVEPFSRTEIGDHKGSWGVFEEPKFGDETVMVRRYLFATYQNDALFVFELKVNAPGEKDADMAFFKEFISDARFQ